jgi:tRNA(Arg) A34 adenosine deaminase TadA
VLDGEVVARAANAVIGELDVTAHAEVQVLRAACRSLRVLELPGTELYVTVEPCLMCLTACVYARVPGVYFGAPLGALRAVTGDEYGAERLAGRGEPWPQLTGGILEAECRALIEQWAHGPRGGA